MAYESSTLSPGIGIGCARRGVPPPGCAENGAANPRQVKSKVTVRTIVSPEMAGSLAAAASANELVQFRKTRCALHGTCAGHGHRTTGASIAQRVVNRFAFFAARRVR